MLNNNENIELNKLSILENTKDNENLENNNIIDEYNNNKNDYDNNSSTSSLNESNMKIVKKNYDKILSENIINNNIIRDNNITYQSYRKIGIKINKNRYNNEIIVENVICGSIADKKGIIKNDIILSLNELDIEHLSVNQINNILNSDNFKNMQMGIKEKIQIVKKMNFILILTI